LIDYEKPLPNELRRARRMKAARPMTDWLQHAMEMAYREDVDYREYGGLAMGGPEGTSYLARALRRNAYEVIEELLMVLVTEGESVQDITERLMGAMLHYEEHYGRAADQEDAAEREKDRARSETFHLLARVFQKGRASTDLPDITVHSPQEEAVA